MQERIETTKDSEMSSRGIAYTMANLSFKTAAISLSVSVFTQPFQAILTQLQHSSGTSPFAGGFFRSIYRGLGSSIVNLYRGFGPYAMAGQKRGAVAVTAKQTTREEEAIENEISIHQRWIGTFSFSQADLALSNALNSKAKLESAKIATKENFRWSIFNYWKLTSSTWGSRSVAGFINFAALGFVGDYISSFYKFNDEFYNKLLGGATAGVVATFFTTLPNSYADRKILMSTIEEGRVLTASPFTMFNQAKNHVKKVGLQEALTAVRYNFLKEVLIRSPQSALTFSIIFGMDHLLGLEPLRRFWPVSQERDYPEESSGPSQGM
ncbi:hypothetical protein [Legionella brunensis]|uniref:Periplasmic ligand-binding sensor domain protein n=1 Tax=Legionella brunensis TaxID=29422 RepID=A0A0W0SKL2_9GAMM|nr:hypothetical protein [Legionella brunensis]KTC83793.1 periplasmic ligand-binding sensor domain protein [Legionella brunensis]